MANIPVRFKRITTTLDEDARARLCQSSGSEHSANYNSVTDLSDLVDSFFEGESNGGDDHVDEMECDRKVESYYGVDTDTMEMLVDLIGGGGDDDCEKRVICYEVEKVCRNVEDCSSDGFKRQLMTGLRHRGFDAGLCKSRWEKTGSHPAGEYEYIDILISGTRYIIEVSFGSEFTIARPTKTYQSLLETIPKITIIKPNELKKLVRLMCAAMRDSLKSRDIMVSPWRKNSYMQAKWLASYKRTTNHVPANVSLMVTGDNGFNGESLLGFEYLPTVVGGKSYYRKEVRRMHVVGNLKALMSGM
ncbi:uncharacterized protein LOC143577431 [Bidens hawaiensis]|uniref:uncharacterized protein LOC143577430 n=1 Tax=Bidens hawaiensis TaxID=980011 RepID=UPI00404A18AE